MIISIKDEIPKNLIDEWNSISSYLIREIPKEDKFILTYIKASQTLNFNPSEKESEIFNKAIYNPWMLPFIDSALALGKSNSFLRKKILLVFSILETSREYHKEFSTSNRSRFYWFRIIFTGLRSVFRLIIGKIILLFI